MANDRWDDDDTYRTRRYGNDTDYERNFWRDRESRGGGSADEGRRARYASLPVFGLDYGNPRSYRDRDRYGREYYSGNRDRDEWRGRNYGDEWSRRDYGSDSSRREAGTDWNRDRGYDWGRRDTGDDWRGRESGERGLWDRTKDEVRSWFGDQDAEYRRQADHRGRGPRGYTRSDDRIREDVNDWLMEDRYIDASEIEVMVVASEVTLTGTVDSRDQKWRAENLAADVLGVKDVHNRLRTRGRQSAQGSAQGTMPSEGTTTTTSSQASTAMGGSSSSETNASTTPRH